MVITIIQCSDVSTFNTNFILSFLDNIGMTQLRQHTSFESGIGTKRIPYLGFSLIQHTLTYDTEQECSAQNILKVNMREVFARSFCFNLILFEGVHSFA